MSDLLKCPDCGLAPHVRESVLDQVYRCECEHDGLNGAGLWGRSKQRAVDNWNGQVIDLMKSDLQKQIDGLAGSPRSLYMALKVMRSIAESVDDPERFDELCRLIVPEEVACT